LHLSVAWVTLFVTLIGGYFMDSAAYTHLTKTPALNADEYTSAFTWIGGVARGASPTMRTLADPNRYALVSRGAG